jgi:hypothetical protein
MAQTIWDTKMSCYWECLREHTDNKKKNPKKSPPPYPQKLEIKNLSPHEPSHWLHEFSIFKPVCRHFQPGLIPSL